MSSTGLPTVSAAFGAATPGASVAAYGSRWIGIYAWRILIVGSFLAFWQFGSGRLFSGFWVGTPAGVAGVLWEWFSTGSIWPHITATVTATVAGFVIGTLVGVLLAFIVSFLPSVERIISPYLLMFYAVPKIAFAPIFIIVFGVDIASKVALVAFAVFFISFYNTLAGVNNVDRGLISTLELMGARRREIVSRVTLPATLPWIFTGARISVRYAVTTAVLGELIGSNRGLGYLIEANANSFNPQGVFAALFILVTITVVLTEALSLLERKHPAP